MIFKLCILTIISLIPSDHVEGSKILGIFPLPSKSHYGMSQPLLKTLAAKGHEVTVIAPHTSKSPMPNYTEIWVDSGGTWMDFTTVEQITELSKIWDNLLLADYIEKTLCRKVLYLPYIQKLIHSREKMVDLLIVEMYFTGCYILIAHKLNVPMIVVLPPSLSGGIDDIMGNPFPLSVTPILCQPFTTNMNFIERVVNTLGYLLSIFYQFLIFDQDLQQVSRQFFHMELPAAENLSKPVAIALNNNHFSFINRAASPNAIGSAGIHLTEANPLSEDLQTFLDEASEGVIFFSLGSSLKTSGMSSQKLKVFQEVFSEIPQRVLWRVDKLNLVDVPPKVKLAKWYPQRDLLEHKNVIAFISHGGLFSILEAVHTETPLIIIPFWFDQIQNAKIIVETKSAIQLDYVDIDKNSLRNAIDEIVNNTKYRENMKKYSMIFEDRPISALDEAVYWTEYVLRHNGAAHLRPHSAGMPLHQYLLLDVIVMIVIALISIFYLFKFTYKTILFIWKRTHAEKRRSS